MADSKVFGSVRVSKALKVLAAAGCVAGLAACSSDQATYRPAPHPSSTQQPTYTQPAPTATNPPPPAPAPAPKKPGGGGCGSKCG